MELKNYFLFDVCGIYILTFLLADGFYSSGEKE